MNSNHTSKKILYDTDIGCDCDDAGALAVLHALADMGEAEILAVTHCTASEHGPGCVDAINSYYGRPTIPIGTLKGCTLLPDGGYREIYSQYIVDEFPNRFPNAGLCPDAICVIRQALAKSSDHDVTIVGTGQMTNLANLLRSTPDDISPLCGKDLIRLKVNRTVLMGGYFPKKGTIPISSSDNSIMVNEFNIVGDIPAARFLVAEWPNELIFCGYEIGYRMITGRSLLLSKKEGNPVRRAYEIYCSSNYDNWSSDVLGRDSWDPATMLYAIRPEAGYWALHPFGRIIIDERGVTTWIQDPNGRQTYMLDKAQKETAAAMIDQLMIKSPALKAK